MTETTETVGGNGAASPGSTAPAPTNDTASSTGAPTTAESATPDAPAAAKEGAGEGDASETLISDDEFESLQDDPAALRKKLQAAYTQSTQKLGPARQLLAALQKDPDALIRALAKQRGIKLGDELPAARAADEADEITKELAEALGPESAKLVRPALQKLVDNAIAPLRKVHEEQMVAAAAKHAALIEQQLTERHPDWKEHEKSMTAIAQIIQPAAGVDPLKYLSTLYVVASHGAAVTKEAQELVDRKDRAARAAAESRVSRAGASQTAVTSKAPHRPTIREAAEMAMRGERV